MLRDPVVRVLAAASLPAVAVGLAVAAAAVLVVLVAAV